MDLLRRFEENWKDKQFSQSGKAILLAVSGGIDSMVMAYLFFKLGIPFAIGNCNFKLRGRDADLDSELVRNWASQHGVTCHQVAFDTQQKVEEWGKGVQETARILRYEWFSQLLKEHNYSNIATAHHADDNAETLLINLFKGTGIAGLHGIPEQAENIIRPLLFARKDEIVEYATANNIPYREDASNKSDYYLRNSVRNNIIPVIQQVVPNVIPNINNTILRLKEAEILYRRAVENECKHLLELRGKDWYISVLKLVKRQPLNTICYELFTPFGFTPAQIPVIIQLLTSETGRFVDAEMYRVIKNRDFLVITAKKESDSDLILIGSTPSKIEIDSVVFRFSIREKPASIPTGADIACLDLKQITFPVYLRRWKTGDYFYPFGMGMKKKKVSKFFVDQKLPLHEKERVWVVESAKRILWIAGMRLDERFKVNHNTTQVLVIERQQI